MGLAILILLALIFLFVLTVLAKTIRIVPQARAGIVERFGKYRTTLDPGLNVVVPFIDKVRYVIDMREQVVSFPPQPVITEDNLVVSIDTVIYFQVTDPVAATYEIANYIQAIEQLTMTTLRNIVGGMDLEETLTSRESINGGLRGVLDEATGKWGVRVNRVEIKGIDPPPSIKDCFEAVGSHPCAQRFYGILWRFAPLFPSPLSLCPIISWRRAASPTRFIFQPPRTWTADPLL